MEKLSCYSRDAALCGVSDLDGQLKALRKFSPNVTSPDEREAIACEIEKYVKEHHKFVGNSNTPIILSTLAGEFGVLFLKALNVVAPELVPFTGATQNDSTEPAVGRKRSAAVSVH